MLLRDQIQYVDQTPHAYLLLSVCQLITHKGHQFGERWPVAGIQGPTLTHNPIPVMEKGDEIFTDFAVVSVSRKT